MKKFIFVILSLIIFAGCTVSTDTVSESEKVDLIPMVMVNNELYLDTGYNSTIDARCGMMDGEIKYTVDESEKPTKNDQSNFGTGFGYQYGIEGTIEILMNDEWRIFAVEEVRERMQFPEKTDTEDLFGIKLEAKDITEKGLTLVCAQSGKEIAGELYTGSMFTLEKRVEGSWINVNAIAEICWNDVAYIIPVGDSVEWEINWEYIYGNLEPGAYRIGKNIMRYIESGQYEEQMYYAYFGIVD